MSQNPVTEAVVRLAAPVVRSLGLVIWGVEVVQGGRMIVRLFVDVPSDGRNPHHVAGQDAEADVSAAPLSASIEQCEEISRHLGLALEVEDVVPQAYVLEVSTPGFNRLFFRTEQMLPYVGDMIEARMTAAWQPEGAPAPRRTWKGLLRAVEGEAFVLEPASLTPEGEVLPEALPAVRIPWERTRRVARVHIFRTPAKPGRAGRQTPRKPAAPAAEKPVRPRRPRKNEALDDDVASAIQ